MIHLCNNETIKKAISIIDNGGIEKCLSCIAQYLGIEENITSGHIIKEETMNSSFDYINIKRIAMCMLKGSEKEKIFGKNIILWLDNEEKRQRID